MPYIIEVPVIDEGLRGDVDKAIGIIRSAQAKIQGSSAQEFVFQTPPDRLSASLIAARRRVYFSTDVLAALAKYREEAKGDRRYLIGVVSGRLTAGKYENAFGAALPGKGLAVFTTYDTGAYFRSRVAYIGFYLMRYAIGFAAPQAGTHPERRGCIFDGKEFKAEIVGSFRNWGLCDECAKKIEPSFNVEMKQAFVAIGLALQREEDSFQIPAWLASGGLILDIRAENQGLPWWLVSAISAAVFFVFLLSVPFWWETGLRVPMLGAGALFLVLAWFNPRLRYWRAFLFIISVLSGLNALPALSAQLEWLRPTDQQSIIGRLVVEGPSPVANTGLIVIALALLWLHSRQDR